MAQKDNWTASCIQKFSNKHFLTCFGELKGKFDGMSSEFMLGFRKRFRGGTAVTGYMTSTG